MDIFEQFEKTSKALNITVKEAIVLESCALYALASMARNMKAQAKASLLGHFAAGNIDRDTFEAAWLVAA